MRIGLLLLIATALAGGCGESDSDPPPAGADLEIAVWPDGRTASDPQRWTLTCPAGGTLPKRVAACRRLQAVDRPFSAVPARTACTQIYGGPAVASVQGAFLGKLVNARFSRTDGCQIERWDRVSFLFPGVP